jgi:hypothetical protein
MRLLMQLAGVIVMLCTGLALFAFWMIALWTWLGLLGIFLGIIFSPGLVIFPFIFWLVEGEVPWLYFGLWAVMWVGGFLYLAGGSSAEAED